jgi:asparagine synthase (glutamine-hydrolysing)
MIGIHGIFSTHSINKKKFQNILFKELKNGHITYQILSRGLLTKISLDKFRRDKIFQKYDGNIVSIDGIILNLKKILIKSKTENLGALIVKLYEEYPISFPSKLLGSFQGFVYLGKKNKLILFTDQVGSRPIFYFYDRANNMLIFSSSFPSVVQVMQSLGYIPYLNEKAAYCLLTFGHMLGDLTLVEEVKRLRPGSILIYHDGELSINQYYRLSNNPPISDSEQECVYKIATEIMKAVYMEYAKDLEYGYRHLATLSGGIDSRTNIAFAKKLGFNDITCFTYSQSNYLDEKIAKEIACKNNINWIFFPLDYGNHLIQYMDEVISLSGGLVNYIGICNLYSCLRKLPLEKYGLLHTGILGGEIFGEYVTYSPRRKYQSLRYFLGGKCSGKLLSYISCIVDKELSRFDNSELFKFYNLGVNAQLMNMHIINQFIDTTSPYLFPPLLEYVVKMPKEYKINKKVYTKMINIYIPEFAKYKWEHYRVSPKYPLYLLTGYNVLLHFYIRFASRFSPYYSMNPFEYWYKNNIALRKGLTLAFRDNIDMLKNCSRLRDDCRYLFKEGDFLEKTAVITLLKALRLLQINC